VGVDAGEQPVALLEPGPVLRPVLVQGDVPQRPQPVGEPLDRLLVAAEAAPVLLPAAGDQGQAVA
jgi:hypothetical protein